MKKFAAFLLMVSMIALTTTSFATTANGELTGESSTKNGKTTLQTDRSTAELKAAMPCFGLGDTLQFNVADLTADNSLTLISYKVDEATLDNSTIQYVNQYTLDANTFNIKYTIRDTEDGIYRIVVNDGAASENSVVDFYYKVGIPTYRVVSNNEDANGTNYYRMSQIGQDAENGTYSAGFVGQITMDSTDVSFADAGITDVGFSLSGVGSDGAETTNEYFNEEPLTGLHNRLESSSVEIAGSVTFIYGMEMHHILNNVVITADAIVKGGESIKVEEAQAQ